VNAIWMSPWFPGRERAGKETERRWKENGERGRKEGEGEREKESERTMITVRT